MWCEIHLSMQAGSVFRNRYSLTGWRWRSPNTIWCGADQVEEPWGPVALKMYALTSDFIREKELLDMPYSSEHWPSRHHCPTPLLSPTATTCQLCASRRCRFCSLRPDPMGDVELLANLLLPICCCLTKGKGDAVTTCRLSLDAQPSFSLPEL